MRTKTRMNGRRALFAALFAAGCAGTPPPYDPPLAHVEVPVDSGAQIEELVSLRAVPADRARALPAGMEARIRIDNETDRPARLDPHAIELVARDLRAFAPPAVAPADAIDVAPGGSAMVTARFAYPSGEGALDEGLRAVDLRWTVEQGNRPYASSLSFDRIEAPPTLSDPWFWEPEPRIVLRGEVERRR
jgi:hypothetical protein